MANISVTETSVPRISERRPWTISWGAVFAGVFTALVSQLLLNMLGIGIGAATLDPFYGSSPEVARFSWAAYAWWAVSGIISAFFGGWVAGALVGQWWRFDGAVHGFIAWCIATLIVAFVFAGVLGGMSGLVANVAGPLATQYAANNPNQVNRIGDLTTQEFSQLMRANSGDSGTLAYESPSYTSRERSSTTTTGPATDRSMPDEATTNRADETDIATTPEQLDERSTRGERERAATDEREARTATREERDVQRTESGTTAARDDRNRGERNQETTSTRTERETTISPDTVTPGPSRYEGQYAYQSPTTDQTSGPSRIAQSRANAARIADAIAQGAIWSFVALLLGALAAVGGGFMASSAREDEIRARTH